MLRTRKQVRKQKNKNKEIVKATEGNVTKIIPQKKKWLDEEYIKEMKKKEN